MNSTQIADENFVMIEYFWTNFRPNHSKVGTQKRKRKEPISESQGNKIEEEKIRKVQIYGPKYAISPGLYDSPSESGTIRASLARSEIFRSAVSIYKTCARSLSCAMKFVAASG